MGRTPRRRRAPRLRAHTPSRHRRPELRARRPRHPDHPQHPHRSPRHPPRRNARRLRSALSLDNLTTIPKTLLTTRITSLPEPKARRALRRAARRHRLLTDTPGQPRRPHRQRHTPMSPPSRPSRRPPDLPGLAELAIRKGCKVAAGCKGPHFGLTWHWKRWESRTRAGHCRRSTERGHECSGSWERPPNRTADDR